MCIKLNNVYNKKLDHKFHRANKNNLSKLGNLKKFEYIR